jgi:Fic-DOC domain mobile mystery protein B
VNPTAADENATPIMPEEVHGLIPTHITLRSELNEMEQMNVFVADTWAFARRRSNLLTEKFILDLHRRMFGSIWRWAGEYRKTQRNLGVDHWRIATDLRLLLDDTLYSREQGAYEPDECALRFHHRLVVIHPFVNGNGRHARMMADLLARSSGKERFTWGSGNLFDAGEVRTRYIACMSAADRHDYRPLLSFART